MIQQKQIQLSPKKRGNHLITRELEQAFEELPQAGLLNVFLLHTSAGLMINENADPDVHRDFELMMNRIVPENQPGLMHTMEGADDMPSHVKSAITGVSLNIPIVDGKLFLGQWQGVYLCEFRNEARPRRLMLSIWH